MFTQPTTIAVAGARGGCGTSTLALALAARLATQQTYGATLDGPDRDALAALAGVPTLDGRELVTVAPNLDLSGPEDGRHHVADLGTLAGLTERHPDGATDAPWYSLWHRADRRVLVVAPCYLALRAAVNWMPSTRPDLVLVPEWPGRSLGRNDVRDVLSAAVTIPLAWRDSIARAADAGVLAIRTPDPLARTVSRVLDALSPTPTPIDT